MAGPFWGWDRRAPRSSKAGTASPSTARCTTCEVIEICHRVWKRDRIQHEGAFRIPLPPGQGTGLGKALKIARVPGP